jgi:hypothetical protein
MLIIAVNRLTETIYNSLAVTIGMTVAIVWILAFEALQCPDKLTIMSSALNAPLAVNMPTPNALGLRVWAGSTMAVRPKSVGTLA